MKQGTYVKITGFAPAQKRQYGSEAELADLSLSAYLLKLVEIGREFAFNPATWAKTGALERQPKARKK